MAFKKGESGNPKGRVKGTENKLTKEAREIFVDTLGKHSGNIDAAFEEVFKEDKTKFLELFSKYAQYFSAKKTESNDKTEVTVKDFNIKDVFKFND